LDPFAAFDPEKCESCGQCFHQCPVMQLPLEIAKAEADRLMRGQDTKHVLQKCTSCFACNFICPNQANPAQRIIDIWHQRSLESGLPVRAKYYTPDNELNFRTYALARMPEDERTLVKSWEDESPCDEVFYPGCNIITASYLTRTKLLDGVNIRGSLKLCCGETYYRTGQYEMAGKAARRINAWQKKLGFKKMIIPCTAGRNMFENVLPKFGLEKNFEIEHMLPWLLGRIERGEIEIIKPLDMTVTIQESCYGKFFGEEFMDTPRKLLEKIGVRVVEQDLCRDKTLCCGIGGGFSHQSGYHPKDITLSTIRSLCLAKKTGAEAIAAYCAGCLQMLSVGKIAYPVGLPVFHILELLQMAVGETPARRQGSRARLLFKGVALNQLPKLLTSKRFFMKEYLEK